MKTKKQLIGDYGESLALDFLIKRDYFLLCKNVKTSYTEIDIVVKKEGITVFIEVKTRIGSFFGLAIDALTKQKQKNLKRAVMYFCRKNSLDFNRIRVDFVAVQIDKDKKTAKINHIKDIM